ncbi:MAG: HAD family phosphatase [Chlamydiales bacterium]|nr:HAD family phosphatase [Chlamydiales bacterium]
MKLNDFDLFLFDFDGLLVDTEHLHYQAYKATLEGHGHLLPWSLTDYFTIAQVSSEHLRTTILKTFPSLNAIGWDQIYSEKKANYLKLLKDNKTQFMPGALSLLEFLHKNNIPSAVVTHSPLIQVKTIRSQLPQLTLIPHWFTREDYENPKPAPDGYLKALSVLNSQKPIGFEDSIRGLESLQAAKIPAVLVRPPIYPPYETTEALCLQSLEQLLS